MIKINPYIIIDFETGGFKAYTNAATEIACLCITGDTLQEIGRYESYIQPYLYEYEQKALDYTGITLDKLKNHGKPLEIVVKELAAKFDEWKKQTSNSHTKKPILVGHNVKFDIPFLQQIFKEAKIDLSKYLDGDLDFNKNFQPQYFDTLTLGKLTWGNDETMTHYKLSDCVEKAGIGIADAHKAMNDVEATKDLLICYANRIRNNSNIGSTNVESETIRFRNHFRLQF